MCIRDSSVSGKIKITGTWERVAYIGWCYSEKSKSNYTLLGTGEYAKCKFYSTDEGAKRAQTLIGQHSDMYSAVNVLNYATIGYPYVASINNCKWYMDNVPDASNPKPGYVIVGKDAAHCAVIDKEGDKFIHTNPVTKTVSTTSMSMIKNYFKNGYVFKDYNCK